jgi:hypothetical protein
VSDYHYIESVREHASKEGFGTIAGPSDKVKVYLPIRVALGQFAVSLGDHVLSPKLARQLKETLAKPTAGGSLTIFTPRRAGSHGDIASAWILAAGRVGAGAEERTPEAALGIGCGRDRWQGVRSKRERGRSDVAQE